MARVLVSLVLASIAVAGTPVEAKDKVAKVDDAAPSPTVSRFLMGTRLGYITCSSKYRTYLEKLDFYELVSDDGIATPRRMDPPSADETTACVHETVYKAKGLQDAAAKQAGTPAAKAGTARVHDEAGRDLPEKAVRRQRDPPPRSVPEHK